MANGLLCIGSVLLCLCIVGMGQGETAVPYTPPALFPHSISTFPSNAGGVQSSSYMHPSSAGSSHNPAGSGFNFVHSTGSGLGTGRFNLAASGFDPATSMHRPGGSGFGTGNSGFGPGPSMFRPEPSIFGAGNSGFGPSGGSVFRNGGSGFNAGGLNLNPTALVSSSAGPDSVPTDPVSTSSNSTSDPKGPNSTTTVSDPPVGTRFGSRGSNSSATNSSSDAKSSNTSSLSSSSKSSRTSRSSTSSSSAKNLCSPPRASSRFSHRFAHKEPEDPLGGFKIVCLFNSKSYYKSGFSPTVIDPCLCTHVNYEFAMLDPKTYEMMSGDPVVDIQENYYQEAVDLKKTNPDLKVMLSLGGWEDSTKKYSEMAADKDRRSNFVQKAISFLKAHEFDGMDLAWEYPNCWQGAIGISPKDKGNFVLLLKELKSAFEEKDLLLSVSVGGIKREIEAAYDVPAVSAAVDHINVMTYDMHGPWEPVTGHHTQFEEVPGDSDRYCNVKGALKVWEEKGADKKKLILGLAYYGKSFTLSDPSKYGLGDPAKGIGNPGPESKTGGFLLYREICQYLNDGNMTEEEDRHAGFYAHADDQWACYDPPAMVVKKAKYVVESGLGGVMMKDMSGDDYKGVCFSMTFPLTKMARFEIIHSVRRINRLRNG